MTDDAGRWERVKDLLDRALDRPPAEREAFLAEASAGDPALIEEVRSLVDASERESDVLERPAVSHLENQDRDLDELQGLEGRRIGAYRLTRELGAGGMGVVYAAERIAEIGGLVAVKLIKRGMDSAAVENRFRYERQILARLTHPNIAHFIDGGVTDDGRPYFVMEYVEGEPITAYAARHDLGVEARIRLFLQVLEAVAFAHQNLVVHRDVKPSNVLVSPGGRVKLLDFGVAKVLGEDGGPDVTLTRVGSRVLTPSYSSPEQIRGEPVTTAADVYSLGVVLYELFSGQRPFDLDTAPLSEVQRVVSFDEPTRPSVAITTGGTAPGPVSRRLSRKLSGDLDTIVLKALRKEPDRRYASAKEFHDDLCRYLDGRPVSARRGTVAYKAVKLVGRYRTAAIALAALFIATGLGGWVAWTQTAEANRQRAIAQERVEGVRKLVNTLLFDIHDRVEDLPGSTGTRKLILDSAYEQLQAVEEDVPEDPQLLRELAAAYRRLGDVQGKPTGANLGDMAAARRSFEEGLLLAQRAKELDPGDVVQTRGIGLLHERFASVLVFSGYVEEGVEEARASLAIYDTIAVAFPDSVRHQFTYAIGLINLSDYLGNPNYPNLGRHQDAEAGYREVATLLDSGVMAGAQEWIHRRYRALVEERLASVLELRNDLPGALALYESSTRTREQLFREAPDDYNAQRDVGVGFRAICDLRRRLGQLDQALAACRRAFDVYETKFRRDSLNVQNMSDMWGIHQSLEQLHLARGDTARALVHMGLVVEWADRQLAVSPESVSAKWGKLWTLLSRALLHARTGVPVVGMPDIQELMAQLDETGNLSPLHTERFDSLRAAVGLARP